MAIKLSLKGPLHEYVHHVHERERLRGFRGGEKDGTEEWEKLRGLRGEEKDGTEECFHGAGWTDNQTNQSATQSVDSMRLSFAIKGLRNKLECSSSNDSDIFFIWIGSQWNSENNF